MRCEGNDTEIGIERLFEDIVVPARAVASIVPLLGYGRAHLVLGFAATINTGEEEWPHGAFTAGGLSAISTRSTVDREVVESLKPEVLRERDEPATTGESVTAT